MGKTRRAAAVDADAARAALLRADIALAKRTKRLVAYLRADASTEQRRLVTAALTCVEVTHAALLAGTPASAPKLLRAAQKATRTAERAIALVCPTEHEEQTNFFSWCDRQTHPAAKLVFAIPNGSFKGFKAARAYREEGLKAGVPDAFVAYPLAPYAGLFLELKIVTGGHVSHEQHVWHTALRAFGYAVAVCHGCNEAITTFTAYIDGRYDAYSTESPQKGRTV